MDITIIKNNFINISMTKKSSFLKILQWYFLKFQTTTFFLKKIEERKHRIFPEKNTAKRLSKKSDQKI